MRKEYKIKTTDVFKSIESERNYQDARWNPETTTSEGIHSLEEWIMYIEDYLSEAKHIISRSARQESDEKVLHIIRKVAGMAVCAMEQHGAPPRPDFEIL